MAPTNVREEVRRRMARNVKAILIRAVVAVVLLVVVIYFISAPNPF